MGEGPGCCLGNVSLCSWPRPRTLDLLPWGAGSLAGGVIPGWWAPEGSLAEEVNIEGEQGWVGNEACVAQRTGH